MIKRENINSWHDNEWELQGMNAKREYDFLDFF